MSGIAGLLVLRCRLVVKSALCLRGSVLPWLCCEIAVLPWLCCETPVFPDFARRGAGCPDFMMPALSMLLGLRLYCFGFVRSGPLRLWPTASCYGCIVLGLSSSIFLNSLYDHLRAMAAMVRYANARNIRAVIPPM